MTAPLRIVLVEDNEADARLMQARLQSAFGDCIVRHVTTATDAQRVLSVSSADLVLLDLGLPGSSGLDAFRTITSTGTTAAVVIVTGLDDEQLARRAVELGAQDYLVKEQLATDGLRRALTYAVSRQRLLVTATRGDGRSAQAASAGDPSVWLG